MFRLKPSGLPKDPKFPKSLKRLDYFIDLEDDRVKSIKFPNEFFRFKVSNNDRYNENRREVVHDLVHREILKRLAESGTTSLYLPRLTETRAQQEPSIEILTTPPALLRCKKHVIVIVNRTRENLGVWSWRMAMREKGIAGGSAVSLANDMMKYGPDAPGLVIMNPGQLLYSHRNGTTLTSVSWDSQPRPSAVHPAPNIDPIHNRVKGNTTVEEHIACVFDKVIMNENFVAGNAELYLIGLGDGGDELVKFLDAKWSKYSARISALAFTGPCLTPLRDADFAIFLARRARAWILSDHPLDTPLGNVDAEWPYQRMSGGHALDVECIMPEASKVILEWFEDVASGGGEYQNVTLEISEVVKKEAEERALDIAGGYGWDNPGASMVEPT